MRKHIRLGTHIGAPAPTRVIYDGPELAPHRQRDWLAHWIKERHGISIISALPPSGPLDIPADLLGRHCLLVGNSGSGKTRLALHLLREQLGLGCSAVVLEFKQETVRQVLACAEEAGLASGQVTVVSPQDAGDGVQGWNVLACQAERVAEVVRLFAFLVKEYSSVWGPRLADVLTSVLTVVAAQQLSILEAIRFLQREDYRSGLLAQARRCGAWERFPEEHNYFATEYASLSKSERASVTAPVLNKVRSLITGHLRAMMCARRDTLDLPSLWARQRLVVIHLDANALGPEGVRMLAGMVAHSLYAVSLRKPGPVPVVLMLDELASQERAIGTAVRDICEKGRQQGLRLLCACQNLGQMPDDLRKLLLGAAVRGFFRQEPDDARRIAQFLTAGSGAQVTRLAIAADKETEWVSAWIVAETGSRVAVSGGAWKALAGPGKGTLEALKVLAASSGIARLYAVSLVGGERVELGTYLRGLPRESYRFHGPSPLYVSVRFSQPKVTVLERRSETERTGDVTRLLGDLPVGEAVIKTDTGEAARIRVTRTEFPAVLPEVGAYLGNGLSARDVAETEEWRQRRIEEVAGCQAARKEDDGGDYTETSEDGSL